MVRTAKCSSDPGRDLGCEIQALRRRSASALSFSGGVAPTLRGVCLGGFPFLVFWRRRSTRFSDRIRRRAFTLVELLVVIVIIGILIALLLPAVQAAREAARRSQCSNNLKQIALALHNYHDVYKVFPFGHMYIGAFDGDPTDDDGGTGFGWGYSILPFLEQKALFDQFDSRLPVGRPPNVTLMQTPQTVFSCPSDTKPPVFNDGAIPNSATSSYQACASSYDGFTTATPTGTPNLLQRNGVFDRDNRRWPVGLRDITDGSSNQVMVAEVKWKMDANDRNRARIYGGSDNANFATGATNTMMIHGQWRMNWTAAQGNPQPHRTAGSEHPGGAQFAFADGSVRFLSETIQHTATAWIDDANAFDRPNGGAGYGLYQRLFSMHDGLVVTGF